MRGFARVAMPGSRRLAALDGLRGCLAVVVVLQHAFDNGKIPVPATMGTDCVLVFFVLSGCVLTRGWGAPYASFLARRIVRLWPVHIVCLGACVLLGAHARLADLALFPWMITSVVRDWHMANGPSWSMCIEVAAMPFMPLVVWCAAAGWLGVIAGTCASLVAGVFVHPFFLMMPFFVFGGGLARYDIRFAPLEMRVPQWLGRVSYSLYLSHYAVMGLSQAWLGRFGSLICLPVVFLVAWVVWRVVESPSIAWSRSLGRGLGPTLLPVPVKTDT